MIKSVGDKQENIINDILTLYNKGNPIEWDPCYNVGGFYKKGLVKDPEIKSDINPLLQGVFKLDVRDFVFEDRFNCVIFDPPFIVGGGKNGKMSNRFGKFETVEELRHFFASSLFSLQRAIKSGGLLIVKCQDFVNGRKNYIFMPEIISMARDNMFECLDVFILVARSRLNRMKNQQHARKYHSYFLVFKNKKRLATCPIQKGR